MPAQPSHSEQFAPAAKASVPRWRRLVRNLPWAQSLSLLVLAVSLLTTYQVWRDAHDSAQRTMRDDFDSMVRDTNQRIEQRMRTYEQVLRGTVALFAAQPQVSREQFRDYFRRLEIERHYPGIHGIGYAQLIARDGLERHVASVRAEGFPNYAVSPAGERETYSSIVFLEPFSGSNLLAFGFDMYSEPVRRAAMERARDTGQPAVSHKVILVQDGSSQGQPGFLMYLPVYRKGMPLDSVDARRTALTGWVYAPFRMTDLMAGVIGEQSANISMEIYDGRTASPDSLLYATPRQTGSAFAPDSTPLAAVHKLDVLGSEWTVATRSLPEFERRDAHGKASLILRAGVGASLLLTLLAWLLVDDRTRAWQIARLAFFDSLTGLPNRKLFTDRLQQAMAKARRDKTRVAVMFIDLDKFKPVNDRFGHAVGDLLLKEVATRLRDCVRESDTVARLGGDEFIMLFSYSEEKRSHLVVAEKILRALGAPFHIGSHSHHISASIGISVYPQDGLDEKTLLKNADTAMYHAKKSGRNQVTLFRPDLEPEMRQA